MDKQALRRKLVAERQSLPDRLQRADALQQVLRFWLVRLGSDAPSPAVDGAAG